PLLSLVVPLAGTSEALLADLLEAVRAQIYEDWELCCIGPPPDKRTKRFLKQAHLNDSRIQPSAHPEPPASEWQSVLKSARGEFLVLVDRTVVPRPHALFYFARTIERHPDAVVIYADEDTIDANGTRSDHYFKPD